jgi:rubrerythrin
MLKMVEHWIQHNEEHARSYHTWADRARKMGLEQVGLILEEVAGGTLAQNASFDKILGLLKDTSND